MLFFRDGETLYGYSATTGKQVWTRTFPEHLLQVIEDAPAVDGSHVFFPVNKGILALNVSDGSQAWLFALPGGQADIFSDPLDGETDVFSTPTIVNGVVYTYATLRGTVYALNEATGAQMWATTTGLFKLQMQIAQGAPTVADGVVYTGGRDGSWYAISAASGNILWSAPTTMTGGQNPWMSSGVIGDGMIFFSTTTGNGTSHDPFYAVSLTTRSVAWSLPVLGGAVGQQIASVAAPVVLGDTVYFLTTRSIMAVNAATGATKWTVTQDPAETEVALEPYALATDGSSLFVTTLFGLSAFSPSGKPLWTQGITGGAQLFTYNDGAFYCTTNLQVGQQVTAYTTV